VVAAIEAARAVFNPRQPIRIDRIASSDPSTACSASSRSIDADRFLRIISRDRDEPMKLDAEVVPHDKQVETRPSAATSTAIIHRSLPRWRKRVDDSAGDAGG
jgi:hypothetical protein